MIATGRTYEEGMLRWWLSHRVRDVRPVRPRRLVHGAHVTDDDARRSAHIQPTARLYSLERLVPGFTSNPQLATYVPVLMEQMELLKVQLTIDVRVRER